MQHAQHHGIALGLAAALAATAGAQLTPDWTARYTTAPDAIGDEAADILTDADGNVYVTGTNNTWGQLALMNVVTIKYAPDGSQQWVAVYDGPQSSQDIGIALAFDPQGDLLVLGRSQGDFVVLVYDTAGGTLVRELRHDAGGIDQPNAMTLDAAGNIYIAGQSWTSDQNDFYVVKLDPSGTVLWSDRYNGPGAFLFAHDAALAIGLDPAGDVFATGYSNAPGSATGDFFTVKYEGGTGDVLWQDRYSAGSNESANDLAVGADGDLYVTGSSFQSGHKYVTIRYRNDDGTRLWIATDAPQFCNIATDIELGGDGSVYVTGTSDPDCDESNFNENIATYRLSAADGSVQWLDVYGSNAVGAFDVPSDMVLDSADHVFITGQNTGLFVLLQYDPETGDLMDLSQINSGTNEIAGGIALALDPDQNIVVAGLARNFNTENRDFLTLQYPSQVSQSATPGDLNGDGVVDTLDFLGLLADWGPCGSPPAACPSDLDDDGDVGVIDLLMLLANWG